VIRLESSPSKLTDSETLGRRPPPPGAPLAIRATGREILHKVAVVSSRREAHAECSLPDLFDNRGEAGAVSSFSCSGSLQGDVLRSSRRFHRQSKPGSKTD
jgi:hypothetical protein